MDEIILQDVERIRDDDWCSEDGEEYQEIDGRGEHNIDKSKRNQVPSINNQMINATNIVGISEDLWYIVQSNMENWVFQTQRMLADELDVYKGKGNRYVNENIQEIQELYADEEQKEKDKGKVEDKEVILIKPYEVSESSSTKSLSFVDEEVNNLLKYMKFVKSPTQTRIFQPLPHYQLLWSRGEQDSDF